MASYGHLAVGLLAGRLHGGGDAAGEQLKDQRASAGTLLFFAALAELPDLDVIGVACGFCDSGPLGHRGASHSFITAIVVGLLSALVARKFGWPVVRTAIASILALASHGILDACGEGGRGIPLLWPLSEARFMSPWRVLPDAPRGMEMFSRPGLLELGLEFLVFFPLTAFALWGRPPIWRRTPRAPAATPQPRATLAAETARR